MRQVRGSVADKVSRNQPPASTVADEQQPPGAATLAAALGRRVGCVALTAWAGSWQLVRAYDKEALQQAYDRAVVGSAPPT